MSMKVLMVEPDQVPYVTVIGSNLSSMQTAVGGLIQVLYPFEDEEVALVCNEEAKLESLPLNRALFDTETHRLYDIVSGTFFICSAPSDSDSFGSLSDEQIGLYEKQFHCPEFFIRLNGQIQVIRKLPKQDLV